MCVLYLTINSQDGLGEQLGISPIREAFHQAPSIVQWLSSSKRHWELSRISNLGSTQTGWKSDRKSRRLWETSQSVSPNAPEQSNMTTANRLIRYSTSIILRIVHGHEIQRNDDLYIQIMSDASHCINNCAMPGSNSVDLIPARTLASLFHFTDLSIIESSH